MNAINFGFARPVRKNMGTKRVADVAVNPTKNFYIARDASERSRNQMVLVDTYKILEVLVIVLLFELCNQIVLFFKAVSHIEVV